LPLRGTQGGARPPARPDGRADHRPAERVPARPARVHRRARDLLVGALRDHAGRNERGLHAWPHPSRADDRWPPARSRVGARDAHRGALPVRGVVPSRAGRHVPARLRGGLRGDGGPGGCGERRGRRRGITRGELIARAGEAPAMPLPASETSGLNGFRAGCGRPSSAAPRPRSTPGALQPAMCPGMWATMYVPDHFAETRLEVLHRLVRDHPFAVLVTPSADGIDANHLPMEIDAHAGKYGTLLGHVARTNPVWRTARGEEALAILSGPHRY